MPVEGPRRESVRTVVFQICGALLVASWAVGLAAWADVAHARMHVCGESECHWLVRSGGFVVLCGTYLAYRAADCLITSNGSLFKPDERAVSRPNIDESAAYGRFAIILIAVGTLISLVGDLHPFS